MSQKFSWNSTIKINPGGKRCTMLFSAISGKWWFYQIFFIMFLDDLIFSQFPYLASIFLVIHFFYKIQTFVKNPLYLESYAISKHPNFLVEKYFVKNIWWKICCPKYFVKNHLLKIFVTKNVRKQVDFFIRVLFKKLPG